MKLGHESWDFGLPPSSTFIHVPIFYNHCFNSDDNYLPNWVELVDDSPDSADSSMQLQSADTINNGLSLISLLFECAAAISVHNLSEAHRLLLELTQTASPYAESSAERVVAYFAMALASRVINSVLGISSSLVTNYKTIHDSVRVFHRISPLIKTAHFAANQAILEALSGGAALHIVDFDIMKGLQWPTLLHALALHHGPPRVRITAIGPSMELLMNTGKRLSDVARRLGISFEYHPIAGKVGEVDASLIPVRRGEAVAVNWVQHCLYDAAGSDRKTIDLIQQLRPKIFTLVEQEIFHGNAFLDRFAGSVHYYAAIFDSLGARFSSDDGERNEVEHSVLYREIKNVLAMGREGEERFGRWRSEVGKWNMREVGMSEDAMAEARMVVGDNGGYSIGEEGCSLKIGWKHTCLYTVSAWTCNISTSL